MNYLITTLFVVDIWVFTYRFILNFLNQRFPAEPSTSFLISGASPEPFEIPLYLILTIILILGIYIFNKMRHLQTKLSLRQKWFLILPLGLLFALQLGNYPMSQNSQLPVYVTPFMKDLALVVVTAYALMIVLCFIGIVKFSSFLRKRGKSIALLYLFITLITAFLVFEPGFPVSWHEYSYYLGPIMEVANGKTIFTEAPSKYGFLSVLSLAESVRLGIFQVGYLPFLIYLAYVLQYFLSFYLVLKVSKSIKLAVLGLFSIITLNYYSLGHLPISLPVVGSFRWLPMVLMLYFFYKYQKITSKILIFLIALLSFFAIDTGISLIFTYLFTLFLFFLKKDVSLKKTLFSILFLSASVLSLFVLINAGLIIGGYKQIDTSMIFTKLIQYSRGGFHMIPMPEFTYFWLVILVFLASVTYYFKTKSEQATELLLLAANTSFFGAVYFVGRSHPHNLFNISLLFLLNLYILLTFLYKKLSLNKAKLTLYVTLFLLFILIPAFNRRVALSYIVYEKINRLGIKVLEDKLPQNFIYHLCRPQNTHFIKSEIDECLALRYKEETDFIQNNILDKEIAIISPDDTYLFYLSGKKNMLYANPQSDILTKEDLEFSLRKVIKVCPRKIVVDPRVFNPDVKNFGTLNFAYTVQPNIFDAIRKECNIEYVQSKCTGQLCIAEVSPNGATGK